MCMDMTPLLLWYNPIFILGRNFWLSVTVSLYHYWHCLSASVKLYIPCLQGVFGNFCVLYCGASCKMLYLLYAKCVFALSPLWGSCNTCMDYCIRIMIPMRVILWLCSGGSAYFCIFVTLACPELPAGVWFIVTLFYSLVHFSIIWGISEPMRLGQDCYKEPHWRMQINLILNLWLMKNST